ncbi:MAG: hypothetical protein ABI639_09695 [Thermoanaerobaculia bacterium]
MRPPAQSLLGIGLFLFIPLVLFLFVAHPPPFALSLGAGIALMVGHRFLALPYMQRMRARKCVWCNRFFTAGRTGEVAVELASPASAARLDLLACSAHVDRTQRFFAFLDRARLPLRLGIGGPLLLLLGTLAAAAGGARGALDHLEATTQTFRLIVGLTVNVAAAGWFFTPPRRTARPAFPVHNFYLLGIAAILWIFRLVGIVWIFLGARYWIEQGMHPGIQ